MRENKPAAAHDQTADRQKIQINDSRAPANRSSPPDPDFGRLKASQKLQGGQRRLKLQNAVQKIPLGRSANGLRFIDR